MWDEVADQPVPLTLAVVTVTPGDSPYEVPSPALLVYVVKSAK